MSNYIRLKTPEDDLVHTYRVDFEPDVEARVVRRAMVGDHKAIFGNAYLFDGAYDIKSLNKLENEVTTVNAVRKTDQVAITITIKYTGTVGWGSYEMLRLFNTQMRRNLTHMKYMLIGRHFFNPAEGRMPLNQWKLEIWQGVMTAINQHDGGILMVADSVHKVIRADTVYDVLQEQIQKDRANFKDNARRDLSGSIVMTQYNNKTYKIDDIEFDKNPSFEFEKKGSKISIVDYYKQQYNIEIKDKKQPLIRCLPSIKDKRGSTPSGPLLLVPELCSMTGLTESLKADFNLKKEMTQRTQLIPNKRIAELHKFLGKMNTNPEIKKEMASWGMSFEPNLVEFTGRELPAEKIYMLNDTDQTAQAYIQKTGDFSKEIRGKKMKVPLNINQWTIIVGPRDKGLVDDFSQTLHRVCTPLGVNLAKPVVVPLENDRVGAFLDACKKVKDVQMVVIVVPNNNKDRYDTIKKVFCCEQPVASQVIVSRTLAKKQMLMSVCTKVGIQMACKLGAEAWALTIPVCYTCY